MCLRLLSRERERKRLMVLFVVTSCRWCQIQEEEEEEEEEEGGLIWKFLALSSSSSSFPQRDLLVQ